MSLLNLQDTSLSDFFAYLDQNKQSLECLIAKDDAQALQLAEIARFFHITTFVLPEFRAFYLEDLHSFKEELFKLSLELHRFYTYKKKSLLIVPLVTILKLLPKTSLLQSYEINFADSLNLKQFKSQLVYWGYEFVNIVELPGEVSFRGDIIDIFSPNYDQALRISLFDNEVESIRSFQIDSQRCIKDELECINIFPAPFAFDENTYHALQDYIDCTEVQGLYQDVNSFGFWFLKDLDLVQPLFIGKNTMLAFELDNQIKKEIYDWYDHSATILVDQDKLLGLTSLTKNKSYRSIYAAINNLQARDLIRLHQDKQITIIASHPTLVKQYDIEESKIDNLILKPFLFSLISPKQVIISLNKKHKKIPKRQKSSILLGELKINDLVVHEQFGIGQFKGLEQINTSGVIRDFAVLIYARGDRLLIPVEKLHVIDKYMASDGATPNLDKLGKSQFLKTKAKAKAGLYEIAQDIIDKAAKRKLIAADKIKANIDLSVLQNSVDFEYTSDQTYCITQIKNDLSQDTMMDKLLVGDVGFGKTEVALNAIYLIVKSGFQVAFMAPTTLLVTQHFTTLQERFKAFDFKVAKLDRFVDIQKKKQILAALKDGNIDVVVGTHMLLNADFAKLNLFIIDEEHKFGVKQKEALKIKSQATHVLSMSATPIPRSLNMALSSLRSYCEITTPPINRKSVKTYVKIYDETILKEVMNREIRRKGQIFYLFNHIQAMPIKQKALKKILPNLRILILHSKIAAAILEKEMLKFHQGEYDILLCTTIIESGIHMPNVNTIIIDEAHRFGMADLHQIRGRVGRGTRQGYCYFLVQDFAELTANSRKRLMALEENAHLGSGANLAMQDLQIRGGGNLIGKVQSGHVKGIGYALYIRMLEQALTELSTKDTKQTTTDQGLDLKLNVSAYICEDLVFDSQLRLELYRRFANIEHLNDVYELETEIIDRFGHLDEKTRAFLDLMAIKGLCFSLGIKTIISHEQHIRILYQDKTETLLEASSASDDDVLKKTLEYLHKRRRRNSQ